MKRFLLAATIWMAAMLLAACGSSPTNGPALTISITISPTTATVNTGATQVFMATVSPSNANQNVTFSLSGGTGGCTGAACGTFTQSAGSATYTAPATAPTPNTVTITATAQADPSKTAAATITVNTQVTVGISVAPATATLVAGVGSQTFIATVTPTTEAQTVTWALAGTGCTGAACGTLNSATANPVIYTPPAAAVTGPVVLTATATADTTKTSSANITVVQSANSLLNGHYAFQLTGFTISGLPVAIAGSITTDGNGNIIGGEEDVNTNGTIVSNTNLSGMYSIASGLQGTFTLASVLGAPVFALTINTQGQSGSVIEFDSSGNLVSGTLQAQDTTVTTLAQLAGQFAFGAASNDTAPSRTGVIGRFNLQASGSITNGLVDISSTVSGVVLSNGTLTGSFNAPDANGRGTAALTPVNQSTVNIAYYIVNSGKLFFLETDIPGVNPLMLTGMIQGQQLGGLDNTALNAASVFSMTGLSATAIEPSVVIGTFTGSNTTLAVTGALNGNDAGAIAAITFLTGSFTSIDSGSGRGTMSFTDSSPSISSFVFYLTAPETGFLLENTVTGNEARIGSFEPQTGGPFSTTSLAGNYVLNAGGSATFDIPNLEGVITVDNLTTSFSGTGSVTDPVRNLSNASISGTYSNVMANGQGASLIPTSPFGSADGVFYLVSPTKLVLIETDSNAFSGVTTATGQ